MSLLENSTSSTSSVFFTTAIAFPLSLHFLRGSLRGFRGFKSVDRIGSLFAWTMLVLYAVYDFLKLSTGSKNCPRLMRLMLFCTATCWSQEAHAQAPASYHPEPSYWP